MSLPILVATSVVRGSRQGESHGGIYLVDFAKQQVRQTVDWNTCEIDFSGRGWDRGMRGIAFWRERVYVAASDLLVAYDRRFRMLGSWSNRYLRHCHEISVRDDRLLLTSTGYDSLLAFDLAREKFTWGVRCSADKDGFRAEPFDPRAARGPEERNTLHLNSVTVNAQGIFLSGLRVPALLHLGSGNELRPVCVLPRGTHNAQPFCGGVLFNDTDADQLRFVRRDGTAVALPVPGYPEDALLRADLGDPRLARQRFARGVCVLSDTVVAGGSSPSTISLYDLSRGERVAAVNLTMDIRNAIHGLEVWPFAQ